MKILVNSIIILLVFSVSASGEIEKIAVPCDGKISFYWWPQLAPIQGWHQDREHSYMVGANAQAPDGFTFGNAEAVIYAKALYKPRIPETESLEALIKEDKEQFLSRDPNITVSEVEPLLTGDGQVLKSFAFFPKGEGNLEQVSYGEEGDFYLVFAVSSRTKQGFTKALGAYKQFLSQYKEKP